ncbi:MAG: type II secretion system protein GspJ [Leptospirales bacterium]|nr:type II secretion system protein GspJ [Leptospirales bacterium]
MSAASARRLHRLRALSGEHRSGVTLTEISLVLLVSGMLLLLVFGIVGGMVRITGNAGPESKERGQAFLALENVRSSLAMTYFNREVARLSFKGDKDSRSGQRIDHLTFSCVNPYADEAGLAAVRDITYFLQEQPRGQNGADQLYVLVRRENYIVGAKPGEGGANYPLARNIESFRLRYSRNGKDWLDEWDSSRDRKIPRLIQIQIKARIGDRTELFESVAAPGIYIR